MFQFSLQDLKNLPNSCIFAIINDNDSTCFISHTNNLKLRIGEILSSNKVNINEHSKLVILQEIEDYLYKLILCEQYTKIYKDKGYSILCRNKPFIEYKVGIRLNNEKGQVNVCLYNKRKDFIIVGSFQYIFDAQDFISKYYSGNMISPVYAI